MPQNHPLDFQKSHNYNFNDVDHPARFVPLERTCSGACISGVNVDIVQLLETYPRRRPVLSTDHERIYAEQYRLNREGARPIENLAQRLERWMHRQVSRIQSGPILETGGWDAESPAVRGRFRHV